MINLTSKVHAYFFTIKFNDSIVWIGSNGGLTKFDGTNWTNYTSSNSGLPLNLIRDIMLDSNLDLCIAMEGQGIVFFNELSNSWEHYNTNNSNLPSNFINRISVSYDNKKWLSTENGIAIQ